MNERRHPLAAWSSSQRARGGLVEAPASSTIDAAGRTTPEPPAATTPWKEAVTVRDTRPPVDESAGAQILFPVAVGLIFVTMLLTGALFG